jgi:hypothetical protein
MDPRNPDAYVLPPEAIENQDLNEKVYQYYALFGCDVERAAIAANIPVEQVKQMAIDGRWEDQLKVLIRLKQSGRPGDLERATNRAINLIQAHRYRLLLERILRRFSLMRESDLHALCVEETESKDGIVRSKLVTRPFADLATALEKCQAMTYLALCDTATDRNKRGENPEESSAEADAHVQIANGLQRMREKAAARKVEAPPPQAEPSPGSWPLPSGSDNHLKPV